MFCQRYVEKDVRHVSPGIIVIIAGSKARQFFVSVDRVSVRRYTFNRIRICVNARIRFIMVGE